jgi:cytochrome c oxidase cbb3-type subunit 2
LLSSGVFRTGLCVGLGLLSGGLLTAAAVPRDRHWPSALTEAPAVLASRPNPYAGRTLAVEAGAKLFRQHCAECHSVNGEGSVDAPSLRSAHVQAAPPGALFWFLTNGDLRHGMPSWSRLPEERRWQLVTYLQSLGPVHP